MSSPPLALPQTANRSRRLRIVWLGILVWTIFAGIMLWWLLRNDSGPTVWIVQKPDSAQTATTERTYGFFKSQLGLQHLYPWLLLGPYVALVALFFPLERGKLRLNIPLNLMACVSFIAASQAINTRTRVTLSHVTIIKTDLAQGVRETNTMPFSFSERAVVMVRNHGHGADAHLADQLIPTPHGFKFPPRPPEEPKFSLWPVLLDLLSYGAVIGLMHSIHFYRRFREREHRAIVLESNLANARLSALRAQLHPHFLFNSLNAVVALLRRDPRLAEATLMSLSELLRLALNQSERQEVTLREEMQFIERYLEIQQTRFGNKFHVERSIEPGALDCLVPALILQPLVENAIRHGIEPAEESGSVWLSAYQQDEKLVLTVEDDGVGLPVQATDLHELKPKVNRPDLPPAPVAADASGSAISRGTGIGLTNLRARLETLYGNRQALNVTPRPGRGVIVRLEIPCRGVAVSEIANTTNLR